MEETQTVPKDSKHIVKRKKTHFFETYINKLLKESFPSHGVSSNALQQLNHAICTIARKLSEHALHLTQISKKKTLSEKEVAGAVKILITGELGKHSLSEGEQCMAKFLQEKEDEKKDEALKKNSRRQDKAGIIFPPAIAEKFLRNFGFNHLMITKSAPVYLAAVLEYLTQDILEVASHLTNENKRVRINIRDLEIGVQKDSELFELFEKCQISFIGGGVVPFIHDKLLVKKPRRRRKKDAERKTGGPHRFRPGTVAIRDIRKYQKMSNCLIFAKNPFEKFVREIIAQHNETIKISRNVFIVLQYYIEQFIVKLLRDANSLAIHSGRVKLMIGDISFMYRLLGRSSLKNEEEAEENEDLEEEVEEANEEANEEEEESELEEEVEEIPQTVG